MLTICESEYILPGYCQLFIENKIGYGPSSVNLKFKIFKNMPK